MVPAFHDSLYLLSIRRILLVDRQFAPDPKRELTIKPNGVFQNLYSGVRFLKRCVFRDPFYRIRVYGRPNRREKISMDTWTAPKFVDIISVYNGNIKHMGRGLIPLALERALQSFSVHP